MDETRPEPGEYQNNLFCGFDSLRHGRYFPSIALLLGLIFGFSFVHPYDADSRILSKFLLQASVVGMGFGMNLHEVIRTGKNGFVYTAAGITFALAAGLLLGRLFEVKRISSMLISVGTAICGGSAIAAVAPILQADQQETAVSLGTIFILNSVALLIFPAIGRALHMSQEQFGLWAALAIHDTSSVVGSILPLRTDCSRRGNHRKTDARVMDRPRRAGRCPAPPLQKPNSVAVFSFFYSVWLPS